MLCQNGGETAQSHAVYCRTGWLQQWRQEQVDISDRKADYLRSSRLNRLAPVPVSDGMYRQDGDDNNH